MEPIELFSKAISLAQNSNQVFGENRDYYITIAQLEALLME